MDIDQYNAIIYSEQEQAWLAFADPVHHLFTSDMSRVTQTLRLAESYCQNEKLFAVGFISYEAYRAFEKYDTAPTFNGALLIDLYFFGGYTKFSALPEQTEKQAGYKLGEWLSSIDQEQYRSSIQSIKDEISDGYTYQVNYTFRLRNQLSGDPYALFSSLIQSQGNGYAAFIKTEDLTICSASPELFFKKRGQTIECKPMKGTMRRGRTLTEDVENQQHLAASLKDQAENIMIVDMIRNDLGRIASIGSVHVSDMFKVEKYPTVLQMTTKVSAESGSSITEIFEALFPCASITGAPKISTIKIIDRLENTPRGIYTGSIGCITPDLDCQFNVAIRTAVIDNRTGELTYGVGGGVVWDSTKQGEYAEALLKADVITKPRRSFALKESLLWDSEQGYFLLDRHTKRLTDSATYFDIPFDPNEFIEELIDHATKNFSSHQNYKIRVLLDPDGRLTMNSVMIPSMEIPITKLRFATTRIDLNDPLIYHKTTIGDNDPTLPPKPLEENIIYINMDGNITESSIANIAVKIDGELVTPPVSAGLLAGTYRDKLIEQGMLKEKNIDVETLSETSEIYLLNSVRKMWKARFLL